MELTSVVALLTNSTLLAAWPHVIFASFVTAGAVLMAVRAWHLARNSQTDVFRRVMRIGLTVTLAATLTRTAPCKASTTSSAPTTRNTVREL